MRNNLLNRGLFAVKLSQDTIWGNIGGNNNIRINPTIFKNNKVKNNKVKDNKILKNKNK